MKIPQISLIMGLPIVAPSLSSGVSTQQHPGTIAFQLVQMIQLRGERLVKVRLVLASNKNWPLFS